jgi:hypothetical protein
MRQDGFVSLWIGKASTQVELDAYIRLSFTDDGELRASQFMLDFALPRWDESCREAECYEKGTSNLREILSGFSYEDQIIPQFEKQIGPVLREVANAVVLLYNFKHQPKSATSSDGPISLKFIGVAEYHP